MTKGIINNNNDLLRSLADDMPLDDWPHNDANVVLKMDYLNGYYVMGLPDADKVKYKTYYDKWWNTV